MQFPDGNLSWIELREMLMGINGKQIVLILNQCYSGQFTNIALKLENMVIVTETNEIEIALNQNRKTIRWKHDEWPFVRCLFDGFLENYKRNGKHTIFDAFQYMLKCNPNVVGIPVQADRPLLKATPQIKYGKKLKIGTVFIQ